MNITHENKLVVKTISALIDGRVPKNSLKALYTFKSDYLEAEPIEKREIAFELLSKMTLKDRKLLNLQQKMPYSIIMNGPKNASFSEMLPPPVGFTLLFKICSQAHYFNRGGYKPDGKPCLGIIKKKKLAKASFFFLCSTG